VVISGEKLIQLENYINDLSIRGCYIQVEKMVPVVVEDPSKKAPPKGKGP
jgi:hypothetical protein